VGESKGFHLTGAPMTKPRDSFLSKAAFQMIRFPSWPTAAIVAALVAGVVAFGLFGRPDLVNRAIDVCLGVVAAGGWAVASRKS
jgi:hypothetical protein